MILIYDIANLAIRYMLVVLLIEASAVVYKKWLK